MLGGIIQLIFMARVHQEEARQGERRRCAQRRNGSDSRPLGLCADSRRNGPLDGEEGRFQGFGQIRAHFDVKCSVSKKMDYRMPDKPEPARLENAPEGPNFS